MNSVYNKKRNWTLTSPNGKVRNEIDFLITYKPKMFMDVIIINQLNFLTNHRMVRGKTHGLEVKQTKKHIGHNKKPLHLLLPEQPPDKQKNSNISKQINESIKINGAPFNHLRFADDLIILSNNPNDLQVMLEQL
ncbi:unnamed protein product [Arctia plantaginis]|uniref:Reverse transcriptase domain-containing protein n=1 Tax=Arctia plantaginis TaxID=874455 RepID=A0A8S0Z5L6_ARCPL|nr:unnamed protein product [Arctia plantaginis]